MTDASNEPRSECVGPPTGRVRRICGDVLWLTPLIALLGWYWYATSAPQPPELVIGEIDPVVADAIEKARLDVGRNGRSVDAWGNLGYVLLAHGYNDQACQCFVQAERLAPDDARWPYLQGVCLEHASDEAAITAFQRAVSLCGDQPSPRLSLAETLLRVERLDEAGELLAAVLERNADDPRANLDMGNLLYRRGRYKEAVQYLDRSIAVEPAVRSSHTFLAECYFRLGNRELAEKYRQSGDTLSHSFAWPDEYYTDVAKRKVAANALISEAESQLQGDNIDAAFAVVRDGIRIHGDHDGLLVMLAKLFVLSDQLAEAEEALEKAIALNPQQKSAHFTLGMMRWSQKDYARAAESLQRHAEINPKSGRAQFELGKCLTEQNRSADALPACQAAVRLRPGDASAHGLLALALIRLGRLDDAQIHVRQVLEIDPDDNDARDLLQEIERRRGKADGDAQPR